MTIASITSRALAKGVSCPLCSFKVDFAALKWVNRARKS